MQLVRGRIKVVENPAPKRWLLVQGLSEESRKIKENLKKCEEEIRSSSCSSACTKENTQKEENTELDSPLSSLAKKNVAFYTLT